MQELRFFRPLAGRTDSGRSPERGGGRKVRARRSNTCSDGCTCEPSPLLASPMVSPPTPAPPRKGQGYRIWRWFDLQLESWNRGCSCFATFESSASRLRTIGIGNFQMRFPCLCGREGALRCRAEREDGVDEIVP